jgi:hypothetical protein
MWILFEAQRDRLAQNPALPRLLFVSSAHLLLKLN